MNIVNDYLVDDGIEQFVGILVQLKKYTLWIFNNPVHGSFIAFGNDPKIVSKQRWLVL